MDARPKAALLPLFALSAIVLGLEVLQSRLVAYSVQNVMIYAVVGIALLGFGAAGSLVAVRSAWLSDERLPTVLAWSALAFSASIVLAHALFVRLTPYLLKVDAASFVIAGLLGVPFLAAGTVVTLSLSSKATNLGGAYAANLVGSGLGCFLPLALLGPLDAEHLLGVLALLAWLSALPYLFSVARRSTALKAAAGITLLVAIASVAFAKAVFPIQPDPPPVGQLAGQYEYAAAHGISIEKRYDRWNPTGRIEVVEFHNVPGGPEPYHAMFYAQDSTAGSTLFRWDGRTKSQVRPTAEDPGSLVSRMCTETLYGQGYFAARGRVLIIGLGGGPDLQCALYHEVKDVDVVEINQDSIAAIRGPLDAWVGGIGRDERVRFHNRDGRSFVHGRNAELDLIQLSGVDTKNNLASGSIALSENLLYTKEAFKDYLQSLTPTGVLSLIRFGEPEALRLAHTAVVTLRDLGITQPERHVVIGRVGIGYGVVVKRTPWTDEELNAIQAQLQPPFFRGMNIYYYSLNGLPFEEKTTFEYIPGQEKSNAFALFFRAVVDNKLAELLSLVLFDISPTTDDHPFFFDVWRYDRKETWNAPHVVTIRNLLLSIIGLSLLLILFPLRHLRRGSSASNSASNSSRKPAFFACLGLGFILLEVWLLHRFTTYLGHQVYALSVVLSTLLVFTGIGAALGEKWFPDPGRRALVGAAAAALLSLCTALLSPVLLEATWQAALGVRALVAALFIAPLGLALGQPFVGGLAWLRTRAPEAVPWCIGINGFCSVIGSVGVIPLLMVYGYSGSLVAGMSMYVLAALMALRMQR
jgi:hypothetical protein